MSNRVVASRRIAFLRGINVGGHRVKMNELRDLFSGLGFAKVATYIASGNVIFDAEGDPAPLETRIESHLKLSLGYAVPTMIRTPDELASIAAFRPFDGADGEDTRYTLHVGLLRSGLDEQAVQTILAQRNEMDDLRVEGRELYWLCRGKITESRIAWPRVAKSVTLCSTMRNVTTIRQLARLYPS